MAVESEVPAQRLENCKDLSLINTFRCIAVNHNHPGFPADATPMVPAASLPPDASDPGIIVPLP